MLHHKTIDRVFKTVRELPPMEPSLNDLMNYDKAQDICFRAWESEPELAVTLAIEATRLSQFCSDAYNILAEYLSEDNAEKLLLYKWATRIGEIYFGKPFFEKERGCFYGLVKTRPYMRALLAVANVLRELGCYEEAVVHLEQLLRLDASDHQGARLVLMSAYLELFELEKAKQLIDKHRTNSGLYSAYSAVLWNELSHDGKEQFEKQLALALRENQYVPKLLEASAQGIERSQFGVGWDRLDGAEDYLLLSKRLWNRYPEIKNKVIKESKKLLPIVLKQVEEERIQFKNKVLGPDKRGS
jgi:tetratricopeptide (TPR) repeat protein